MRLSSVLRCSLHSEGFRAVLVRSISDKMKFAVFFLVCLVAMAAAAPQFITTYPGITGARTLVTGPTVVNGYTGTVPVGTWGAYYGARLAPGYFGAYTI